MAFQTSKVGFGHYARDMSEFGHAVMCGHGYEARNDTAGEECVVDNLVERWTLLGIRGEDMLYELTGVTGYFAIVREFVLVVTNAPGRLLIIMSTDSIRKHTYK